MNTYVKSKRLFDRIEGYHRDLADHYARIASRVRSRRAGMLLEYLAGRESRFAEGVARFRESSPSLAEETWQQYVPATEELEIPPEKDGAEEWSIDEAADRAVNLEERLTRFLRVVVDKAGATDRLREVLQALLEQHEEEEAKLIQTITDLKRL
jgi:hypothetical protein